MKRTVAKKRVRSVQHKENREERRSKETTELKRENRILKRQVATLRKELSKPPVVESQEVDDVESIEIPNTGPKCAKCAGTQFSVMTLPSGATLQICKECKTKLLLTKSDK